jgi:hypothetical protein
MAEKIPMSEDRDLLKVRVRRALYNELVEWAEERFGARLGAKQNLLEHILEEAGRRRRNTVTMRESRERRKKAR